jgi:hypothetical protein
LIRQVRIEPSRKVRSLRCFALLVTDDRYGESWRRFTFSEDAPLNEIISGFQANGVQVEDATIVSP